MPKPHVIKSTFNGLDMLGFVTGEFFRCGSASGPLAPSFTDDGEAAPGRVLRLAYNYDTDEYASRTGGWECNIVRVNRKSITVRSQSTGNTRRIEL